VSSKRVFKAVYCVWIVAPDGNPHWRALNEVAEGIFCALTKLGYGAYVYAGAVSPRFEHDRLIVFNAHVLPESKRLPEDAIIFNAEQVPPVDAAVPLGWAAYLSRLKRHIVWDYSDTNRQRLAARGIDSVLCPVGHYAKIERVPFCPNPDIDVLFYGSINERRKKILTGLTDAGFSVKHLFGIYGEDRDAIIARSKVILNVHFYPAPIWEIFRCSYAIANGKCVVSEDGGSDFDLEAFADKATVLCDYDQLVDRCAAMVRDENERTRVALQGHQLFAERDQTSFVKQALKATPERAKEDMVSHG